MKNLVFILIYALFYQPAFSQQTNLFVDVNNKQVVPFNGFDINPASLFWQTGQTVRIALIGGTTVGKTELKRYAREWEKYANIHFVFVSDSKSPIRIGFRKGPSWSAKGKEALSIRDSVTANIGVFQVGYSPVERRRAVLQLFGHILGLVNEHPEMQEAIQWDTTALQHSLKGLGWDQEQLNQWMARYAVAHTNKSYDPVSIMRFHIPARYTSTKKAFGYQVRLSLSDKSLVQSLYPKLPTNRTALSRKTQNIARR